MTHNTRAIQETRTPRHRLRKGERGKVEENTHDTDELGRETVLLSPSHARLHTQSGVMSLVSLHHPMGKENKAKEETKRRLRFGVVSYRTGALRVRERGCETRRVGVHATNTRAKHTHTQTQRRRWERTKKPKKREKEKHEEILKRRQCSTHTHRHADQ